jgi:Kef-type K+ transport system membrane component KefB
MSDFELSRLLLSLVLLLSFALALGQIFDTLRLPRVIGEISAGLLLGPSFLGAIAPEIQRWIFHAFDDQEKLLSVFYWLGLILLMFSAGFRISTTFEKSDRSLVLKLIVGGIGLPFLFGFVASPYFQSHGSPNNLAFSLVMAVAASVTSIPVLTKVFLDLGIASGRFARLTLTAAAIQDLLLWTVLSVAIAVQQGQILGPADLLPIVVATIAFTLFAISLAPTLLRLAGRQLVAKSPDDALIGYTMLVCLMLVSMASVLQVNIVFGALLAGLVIGRFSAPRMDGVRRAISNVSAWFFVPIYFALVGLKMNLGAHLDLSLLAGFLVASSCVKIASVVLATRSASASWTHAVDYGVVMNARGGPGIVLASLAYASKIIDEQLFVALVMTSILTSLMAGIWLRRRLDVEKAHFA